MAQGIPQPSSATTEDVNGAAQQNKTDNSQALLSTVVERQRPIIAGLMQQMKLINEQLQKSGSNDEVLAKLKLQLDGQSKTLQDANAEFTTRLATINARLEQLGAAPADDQPAESSVIIDERARLLTEKGEINAVISETTDTLTTVKQLAAKVSDMRRELFTKTLSNRVTIDTSLADQVWSATKDQFVTLSRVVQSWWRFVIAFKLQSFLAAAFVASMAALIIQFGARRILGALHVRDPALEDPSYLNRLSVTFWSTAIPSGAVGAFLGMTYVLFDYFNILRPDIAVLLEALFLVVGLVFFINRLAYASISPDMPAWRIISIEPRPGRVLIWLITLMALVSGLDLFFSKVNQIFSSPLTLTMAKSLLSSVVIGLLILTIAFLKPIEGTSDAERRSWPQPVKILLIALGLLPIITALCGYIGFARFVAQQIVVTGAFLVTMYLGFLTGRAVSEDQAFVSSYLGQFIRKLFHFNDAALDRVGLLIGIMINVVVAVVGVPLVLMQFGFQWSEIKNSFQQLMTGIQIGSISISLMGLASGVALFFLGYLFTKWFQSWLDNRVMARGRVDTGVRNSIRTVIGYVGLFFSGLIGVSAAGFNLSNLALIAGGLSLGIGFGLQNIVQNFVSGLILLAERPFKVGDWVEADTVSGIVKKISVRATEVETFDKLIIVVPNSTLINGNVGNRTLRNKLGRITIRVQTSYTDNPRHVHECLNEIIRGHPSILKNPEPFVAFQDMTGSLLTFDIYAFVADITSTGGIKNELRFQIVEKLNAEGVSLSISTTDIKLHISENDKIADVLKEEAANLKEVETANKPEK